MDLNTNEDIDESSRFHPSIIKIKELCNDLPEVFNFHIVDEEHVKQELISLNSKKSAISGDIPVRILKQFCDAYLPLLTSK